MATEKRLIYANALMEEHVWKCGGDPYDQYYMGYQDALDNVEVTIENQPTVDAVEVVHGLWEPRKDVPGFVRCSVCHDCNIYDDWPDGKKWNYCPNCGADMRERKENNNAEN